MQMFLPYFDNNQLENNIKKAFKFNKFVEISNLIYL